MKQENYLTADIQSALLCAQEGLNKYPHDSVYQNAIKQIETLSYYLNSTANDRDADILADFNLGQMAARELGNDEQVFANHLHKLQRFVDEVRG
jgi:Tsi6